MRYLQTNVVENFCNMFFENKIKTVFNVACNQIDNVGVGEGDKKRV